MGGETFSYLVSAISSLSLQPNERVRKGSLSYVRRDGSSTHVTLNHTGESLPQVSGPFLDKGLRCLHILSQYMHWGSIFEVVLP